MLDEVGLEGMYNFVYVPFDFKKSVVFRYGVVNFEQHEQAVKAMSVLDGCEVQWNESTQSLHAIIERYRNSPLMHNSVPEVYKPLLFEGGVRTEFPAPTRAVSPPKHANKAAAQTFESTSAEQSKIAHDRRTTLIVKNLPKGCTHGEFSRILDEVGLGGLFNFLYVPFDFKKSLILRYGFVNFEQHEDAMRAIAILDGFSGWVVNGEKACEVEWGDAQQTLQANIERYRNSSLMHSSVPDEYKPVLFKRGMRVTFPAPTKAVKPLKFRKSQQS
jgi:RNA recognition motif-containing protein